MNVMSSKRRRPAFHDITNTSVGTDQPVSHSENDHRLASSNSIISTAQLQLMEQFVEFCKFKKAREQPERNNHVKEEGCKLAFDAQKFEEHLTESYGSSLPADIIEDISSLINPGSDSKCKHCCASREKLVFDILDVLSQAASKKSVKGNGDCIGEKCNQLQSESIKDGSFSPTVLASSSNRDPAAEGCKEAHLHQLSKSQRNVPPVIDTPFIIPNNDVNTNVSAPHLEHNHIANKRLNYRLVRNNIPPTRKLFGNEGVHQSAIGDDDMPQILEPLPSHFKVNSKPTTVPHLPSKQAKCLVSVFKAPAEVEVGETKFKDKCNQMGKITDEVYNNKNFRHPIKSIHKPVFHDAVNKEVRISHHSHGRFEVNDVERGFYSVLCGLAYS